MSSVDSENSSSATLMTRTLASSSYLRTTGSPCLLRVTFLPVVTLMGLLFGGLLGGAAVIENVFAWPGLGLLMVDSINTRDYPQIQGSIGVFAAGYVIVNLLVDLLYVLIDPRIRYGRASA